MTTTISPSMIDAAEVWDFSSEPKPFRSSSFAKTYPTEVRQTLSRMQSDLAPVVIEREDTARPLDHSQRGAMLGIPVIVEGMLKAGLAVSVVCPDDSMGAIEIWSRNDRDELGLNGAIFASLSRFASISQHVRFPRGSGLPGQCWEDRQAKIVTGLGSAPNFMRAAGARAGGLDVGAALPVMTSEFELNCVVLLLSSKTTPIARVFEIWDVDVQRQCLRHRTANDSPCDATADEAETVYRPGEGVVGKVWSSGVPLVSDNLASVETKRLHSLVACGLSTAIAWPIYVGETIKSVFVMLN